MIEPMYKYQFLVERNGYLPFLQELRKLGVLHVREQAEGMPEAAREQLEGQRRLRRILDQLEKREVEGSSALPSEPETGWQLAQQFEDCNERLDDLEQELEEARTELQRWRPWGLFSRQTLDVLADSGLHIGFYTCPNKKWKPEWPKAYPLAVIERAQGSTYFIALQPEGEAVALPPAGEAWPSPALGTVEWQEKIARLEKEQSALEEELDELAAKGIPALYAALQSLQDRTQFAEVMYHTRVEADEHLMVLEGFAPQARKKELDQWLEASHTFYLEEQATPEDTPPVLLRNGPYARLFEPIAELFALPDYAELDLTPLFAPFFMLFFGFCLGDAGYGLVMVLGAFIYQFWAREDLKPILRLVQWLGLATVLFGALSGTLFGINLLDNPLPGLEAARQYMLDSNQLFQLALILGLVQIIFGLTIKAVNQSRRFGWAYAMVPVGWIIVLLSLLDIGVLKLLQPYSNYSSYAGLGLIILFSDPKAGLFGRIGKGLWELYGITGFFGDLLSYIRLFALGISSAILGYVVNSIGVQLKDSIPYLGPVLFMLFLLVGHGANLLIASLGAFVHPLRLTFVEFYKNAGFVGGGRKYDPLRQRTPETESETF